MRLSLAIHGTTAPTDDPNAVLDKEELMKWNANVATPIRLRYDIWSTVALLIRVTVVLRTWMEEHPKDFINSPSLLSKVKAFLVTVQNFHRRSWSQLVTSVEKIEAMLLEQPPAAPLPTSKSKKPASMSLLLPFS